MKKALFSIIGGTALLFTVACNDANDQSDNADSAAVTTEAPVENAGSSDFTVSAGGDTIRSYTTGDGRRYVLRPRRSAAAGTTGTSEYDTVWTYIGTEGRWYTVGGTDDTVYFDTDEWRSWWESDKSTDELKSKSGDSKVKVDDDGSWKVKDADSKTKSDESGKIKTKPKGEKS